MSTWTRSVPPSVALLLRPREAAEALAISQRQLWSLTMPRGPIRCMRIPGRGRLRSIRYSTADLQRWIAEQLAAQAATGREDDA